MNRVDIARFEFDFDTTWAAFFTDSKLRIYSRYGGRDEHEPDARLNKSSLLQTMREVLEVHKTAQAVKPAVPTGTVAPLWQPEPKTSLTPLDIPLLRRNHQGCVHCHQVREYGMLQSYHDAKFRSEFLFPYPLPESLGLEFDPKHGHQIARVTPNSAAASAGLQPGDIIDQVTDVPIHSEFDLRWSLHRLPQDAQQISLQVARPAVISPRSEGGARAGKTDRRIKINFPLPANWRHTELGWRKSMRSVPVDWSFRAAALPRSRRAAENAPANGMAILVFSVKPSGFAEALDLQKGDLITALVGDTREREVEQFRSDLLRRFAPGEEVRLTVLRAGKEVKLKGKMPAWFTPETSVP